LCMCVCVEGNEARVGTRVLNDHTDVLS
jgi:hypothetical protein